MSMNEWALRSQIVDESDPTLLTYEEIKQGWGSVLNFMLSYGLKPYNPEDIMEAKSISRMMKTEE
jgi:hypothetical protein